jgi:hypothetical protein
MLIQEKGEKSIWPCLGSKGVDAPVECGVWLRTAAQVGLVEQVHCDEFF